MLISNVLIYFRELVRAESTKDTMITAYAGAKKEMLDDIVCVHK